MTSTYAKILMIPVNQMEYVFVWEGIDNVVAVSHEQMKVFELQIPFMPWELKKVFWDNEYTYFRRVSIRVP